MILLFSGGIDSYVAWHYLDKPKTIYFDLGTEYSEMEKQVIKKLIPNTIIEKVLDLSTRQVGVKAYVPYRNLYLAMLASKYSGEIIIAGLKDDMVIDKSYQAFDLMSKTLRNLDSKPICISSPFWDMTKSDIVNWFINFSGCSSELLLETFSCYYPTNNKACMSCPACFRKWVALQDNGIKTPPFKNKELMVEYLQRAYQGEFDKKRCQSLINVVLKNYDFHLMEKTRCE